MGTHPIFESDFDCLTDAWWVAGKTLVVVRKVRAMTRIGPALNQPMSKKKAKEVQLQKRNQKRKNQKKILNDITRPERSVIVHDLDHTRAKRNLEKSQKIEKKSERHRHSSSDRKSDRSRDRIRSRTHSKRSKSRDRLKSARDRSRERKYSSRSDDRRRDQRDRRDSRPDRNRSYA